MSVRARLFILYLIAFLGSIGATLLTMGIFYFTANRWGWDARRNLSLAAGQGVVYTISALGAHAISSRWGRRKSLVAIYALMALASGAAAMCGSQIMVVVCLLAYTLITALNWPMLESLCSESRDARELSRHVGAYNITWAASGAIALIGTGWLIERWQQGIFILPLILHGVTSLLMICLLCSPSGSIAAQDVHLEPEPELARSRELALWLSRIALPAMYVVNFGLSAILPLTPVMQQLSPSMQTLYGSIWVAARMVMFGFLAATAFWHTRPRLLLLAAVGLLASFLLMVFAPHAFDPRAAMIAGQLGLGISMGLIYTASLYFGMVLSRGSTEHGGYHEALVGLGGTLGPGAGALTQWLWPGNVSIAAGAVAGVVAISVVAAGVASVAISSGSRRASARV